MGIVYLGYTSGTPIASGSNIPMTQVIRRKCISTGTDMTLKGTGYYLVSVNATLSSTAGGDATITLYQDGTIVNSANASSTIDANGTTHLSFQAVVRNNCCTPNSVLTLNYTGAVLTSTYASVVVENI